MFGTRTTAAPKDPCKRFTYHEDPPGGGSWTDYITKKGPDGKDITGWDRARYDTEFPGETLHGHHVVMKNDGRDVTDEARAVLCSKGIDPYIGLENLVFSPLKCHSNSYAKRVRDELYRVRNSSKSQVVDALRDLADVHRKCPQGGLVPQLPGS